MSSNRIGLLVAGTWAIVVAVSDLAFGGGASAYVLGFAGTAVALHAVVSGL